MKFFASSLPAAARATALRVRARLIELEITDKDIAKGLHSSPGSITNCVNGHNASPRTRGQITDFLCCTGKLQVGEELWPGIKAQPPVPPLGKAEKALLADMLGKLAALGGELATAKSGAAQAEIRARATALFTSEFVSAWRRQATLGGAGFLIDMAPITAPFRVELLAAMGMEVTQRPGGGIKIKLSGGH